MAGDTTARPHFQAAQIVASSLTVVMIVAALGWLTSNVREVPPEKQAVIFRFGAVERVQNAGLLLALPDPLDHVTLLPSPQTVIRRDVEALQRSAKAQNFDRYGEWSADADAGSGFLLTADASVVQLDVSVFYRISEPRDYVLQQDHIGEAVDRLVARNAVLICAQRDLDAILVARPELVSTDSDNAGQREQLKSDLLRGINHSLGELKARGAGLGILVDRVDIRSNLPKPTLDAFNAVLTASQDAEAAIAQAQNDAAKDNQAANQEADHVVQAAEAASSERLSRARTDTASIIGLAAALKADSDPTLLVRLYHDRVAKIFAQAASVITVDPKDDARLILQGAIK